MCENGSKIQDYFTSKIMPRTPHPVYSPDLSPDNCWFIGYAIERPKGHPITDESKLEDKLTDIWEYVHRDVFHSSLIEWTERLEWVIEYAGDYDPSPH
jgi:hypothetical protein